MTPDRLLEIWRGLGEEPPSPTGMQRVRLDTDSAIDVFACIFWPSRRPGILIEGAGEQRPTGGRIPSCRGVRTVHEVVAMPEQRTILRIVLEDDRLLAIFAVLSADLIGTAIAQPTASGALKRCIDRLCMWQGLFERVPAEGLSEESQRGLLGELLVLETLLLERLDPLIAVKAWVGPDPAHQDFIHLGTAIEVKTSLAKRHTRIVIANEKQLDERPHDALVLAHLRMDESAGLGQSLPMVIARLRQTLSGDPAAALEFDDRLMLGGYLDVHSPLYTSNRWRLSSSHYYRVEGEFPRLTEANLPTGVGDIHYSIIADDLGQHEITFEQAAALLEINHV
ncbi:PD-(D/E)XK motif protein [Mesorhizobium sp. AA22]|uniref:PD-(D/E)XK motif protein n=1 Tax=Mesorhizobium sp. AA22 TaxID=1854057 RepID=UPI0007EDFC79|nr:PD-(D/E)XK motif protein [Mesorhizobium sp. AA22]QIA20854.1 PD-(D/E)XK motif protein [Mesorhizobium sp. AA22]